MQSAAQAISFDSAKLNDMKISLIPGWGWIVGGVYFGSDVMVTLFTGNSIGEHFDYYIEDNFDKNNGTLLKWWKWIIYIIECMYGTREKMIVP